MARFYVRIGFCLRESHIVKPEVSLLCCTVLLPKASVYVYTITLRAVLVKLEIIIYSRIDLSSQQVPYAEVVMVCGSSGAGD